MRFSTIHLLARGLLAMALLLFGAASAGAYAIDMTTNYNGIDELGVSDTITVEVTLDASSSQNGEAITAVTANIIWDAATLEYDEPETVALPDGTPPGTGTDNTRPGTYPCGVSNPAAPVYPYGDNGSRQAYALYTPSGGKGIPAAALFPTLPPWQTIPDGSAPPGKQQLNLTWIGYPLGAAVRLDTNCTSVWLGTIVIHVEDVGTGSASTYPSVTAAGGFMRTAPSGDDLTSVTPVTCENGGTCPVDIVLPEPTGAGLSLAALATLYALRRLRRRA